MNLKEIFSTALKWIAGNKIIFGTGVAALAVVGVVAVGMTQLTHKGKQAEQIPEAEAVNMMEDEQPEPKMDEPEDEPAETPAETEKMVEAPAESMGQEDKNDPEEAEPSQALGKTVKNTDHPAAAEILDKTQLDGKKPGNPSGSNTSSGQGNSGGGSKPPESGNSGGSSKPPSPVEPPAETDEYQLVWEDNFDGTELNMDHWNYEYHEPGWVNNELQKYVDDKENIYVRDGKLVIQAIKTGSGESASYTSGRINTKGKHDYKYGRFETRAKVPKGKGFLPAFWMMPTDENLYGQWPKCGEIDIMEVLGDQTGTTYSTLHFGEPHTQKQKSSTLATGDFSQEFHVFACEWEPGEMRFYVDGKLFFTENDWFTKKNGFGEIAYPAPYDQPFYLILNLAVGGNWPGNPEANAEFGENAQLIVDYVRVYEKDNLDENVEKPVKDVVLRDPDADGNYMINGDFSVSEILDGGANWALLTAGTGAADAEITGGALHIRTMNEGEQDYSVQIVQPNLPLEKGYQYKVSFDACADEMRTMIVSVTAPDKSYSRYLQDTKVDLPAPAKAQREDNVYQHYEFTFDMTDESDANGRLEFNLGNQKSSATVHIRNVRLEKIKQITIEEPVKGILPDGNYVYNGGFDEGKDRLKYWIVENHCESASVTVTNQNMKRELKASVPAGVTNLQQVILKQSDIAIKGGKTYILSFDAYADGSKTIQAQVAGNTFTSNLTAEKKTFSYSFQSAEELTGSELFFLLGVPGTIYLDNVRIQEDGLLVNGDFSNGMTGYEVYCSDNAKVTYVVDGLQERDAFSIDIEKTGNADWNIQLKQNDIKLEKDVWYKISFDAKSTKDRQIMYALQRDGSSDDNWIPYSGTQKIAVSGGFQNYSTTFQMKNDTDTAAILSISMGAVSEEINEKHTIVIDNIVLEKVEEPQQEEIPTGSELIKNGDFAQGEENWILAITAPGAAAADFTKGNAEFNISNVGDADWNIQLKQENLALETGKSYRVQFTVESNQARTIKFALLDPVQSYKWYGGADIELAADRSEIIERTITVTEAASNTIDFVISMGKLENIDTPPSVIKIDNISIVKLEEGDDTTDKPLPPTPGEEEDPSEEENAAEMLKDRKFSHGVGGETAFWQETIANWDGGPGAAATSSIENGILTYDIANAGTENWNVQLKQGGLTVEPGKKYQIRFKAKSSQARTIEFAFVADNGSLWYGGESVYLETGETKEINTIITTQTEHNGNPLSIKDTVEFQISMGKIGDNTPASIIELSEISVVKVAETDEINQEEAENMQNEYMEEITNEPEEITNEPAEDTQEPEENTSDPAEDTQEPEENTTEPEKEGNITGNGEEPQDGENHEESIKEPGAEGNTEESTAGNIAGSVEKPQDGESQGENIEEPKVEGNTQ